MIKHFSLFLYLSRFIFSLHFIWFFPFSWYIQTWLLFFSSFLLSFSASIESSLMCIDLVWLWICFLQNLFSLFYFSFLSFSLFISSTLKAKLKRMGKEMYAYCQFRYLTGKYQTLFFFSSKKLGRVFVIVGWSDCMCTWNLFSVKMTV